MCGERFEDEYNEGIEGVSVVAFWRCGDGIKEGTFWFVALMMTFRSSRNFWRIS
jgi:hypothetical protein